MGIRTRYHTAVASPSMRREWIEMLKMTNLQLIHKSPSMRREWIEIYAGNVTAETSAVSLHAEGVD